MCIQCLTSVKPPLLNHSSTLSPSSSCCCSLSLHPPLSLFALTTTTILFLLSIHFKMSFDLIINKAKRQYLENLEEVGQNAHLITAYQYTTQLYEIIMECCLLLVLALSLSLSFCNSILVSLLFSLSILLSPSLCCQPKGKLIQNPFIILFLLVIGLLWAMQLGDIILLILVSKLNLNL